ncbi:MAG TPA: c-type cytochrome, partial [Pirellula sp.]|nr:c-type cytochrome [Pirellula sp.]
MPVFSNHAKFLAAAFVAEDQDVPSLTNVRFDIAGESKTDLEAGRQLLDTGCVQCHAVRGESLPGSIGIDLADIGNRVQPEWFHAFLQNPTSLKKNTRMPSFFPEGKSSSPQILNGDVSLQIASIWRYLNTKDQPLPAKLEQSQSQEFELKPLDRPILLRTFMETSSAGTHAIAVGFPEQHHYAFDARKLRLAEIWKWRFLNAQSTWFDRFVPPAIPLGTERINLPMTSFKSKNDDGTFAAIESSRLRFSGYHLDKMGVPTFRYSVADFDIDDQIKPISTEGLSRKLTITRFAGENSSKNVQVSFVV